jgi:hypothetical protein
MKFHCIGPNAGERRPDTCRGDIELRPCDINHLERQKERRNEHRSWGSFFDPLAGTYRCLYCQGATNAPALVQKQWEKIEELLRKKHEKERPRHEQFPRLRKSEAKRRRYVKEHWRELYPNFKIDHEAREEGRRKPSLKRSLARKKASLLYWWNGENSRLSDRLGLCVFCNKLQINRIGQPARFHWRCYSHWVKTSEGRAYVSLRRQGKKPSLPIRKREAGRSVTEEALKTSFATALLHYFMGKSYREIAEKYGIDYRTAYYRVDEFFENLPDDLSFLPDSFSETVEMLIEERARERAAVPQAPAESAENDSDNSPQFFHHPLSKIAAVI